MAAPQLSFSGLQATVLAPAATDAVCNNVFAALQAASHVTTSPLLTAMVPQKLFSAAHPLAAAALAGVPVPHQLFEAAHPAAAETLESTKVATLPIWVTVATWVTIAATSMAGAPNVPPCIASA